MNRRRQPLLQSAPDLLYKEALSEPYNSAKSPGKTLATGAFCPDGVKNSLPALYQKLVGMVAPQVRLELTTLRLTAECSAIELLRIIRGLWRDSFACPAVCCQLPARLHSCLGFAAASLPRSSLCFGSGKNFRSSRSSWIPATSYSPKPFPAQYHQRLEA